MATTVANKRQLDRDYSQWVADPHYEYIGRSLEEMHFGNPFSHLAHSHAAVQVGSRKEAIEAFEKWLRGTAYQEVEPERRHWILRNLHQLKDKILVCWCWPLPCHGEIYARALNENWAFVG